MLRHVANRLRKAAGQCFLEKQCIKYNINITALHFIVTFNQYKQLNFCISHIEKQLILLFYSYV